MQEPKNSLNGKFVLGYCIVKKILAIISIKLIIINATIILRAMLFVVFKG
jgi:hypothetical protein